MFGFAASLISTVPVLLMYKLNFSSSYGTYGGTAPPEGDEVIITAMSALAAVGQYMSTKSAKSTFLHNTGLVVKAISSKLPHDQDMQAQNNVISTL